MRRTRPKYVTMGGTNIFTENYTQEPVSVPEPAPIHSPMKTITPPMKTITPARKTVRTIVSKKDKENVLKNNKIVVVKIFANWCGPCKATKQPYIDLASKNSDSSVLYCEEDIDKKISQVDGVPTFHIYVNGEKKKEILGPNLKDVEKTVQEFTTKK